MKPSQFRPTLLGSVAAIGLMASAGSAFADDVSDLRQQINIMQEKIAKLEADKSLTKRRVAAAAAVEAGDKPRSWKLPGTNTSISIGGYVKADLLWDLGSRASLTTGQGYVNGNNPGNNATNGGAWQFHARESRFYIRTWTPTDWGELATHFEGDFYGLDVNTTNVAPEFRLRHAYGQLGPVLAGQTWTTWMPVWAGAETLDFGGAVSGIFVRQTQVRYTHNFGGGFFMDAAIENPIRRGLPPPFGGEAQSSGNGPTFLDLNTPGAVVPTKAGANSFPDFVLTAYYNMPKGRIWVGGIVRQLEYDTGTGRGADSAIGWGVAVAGAFRVTKKVRFGFQGVIGRGVYSYFNGGGPEAVIKPTANGQGSVDTVLTWGGYVWGQYRWTDTIRSTVMWSYFKVDLNDSLPGGVNANTIGGVESVNQAFVNLIWSPVPQVNIGIEYSWFQQNNFAGPNFTGNRIHIAFQYSF